ncbi:MAG: hypothetical protein PVF58_17095 [Candidatus Methanofastidiosia archaeon]|jgi:hypothetical protein
MAIFFVMDYLFTYESVESVLEVSGDTIRVFLGNWYIRKFLITPLSEIKEILRALNNFFTFLEAKGFISEVDLEELKGVCKDVSWFEMQLKTYFSADDDKKFCEWIDEYNYDWR